jgi:hypothetical protein
MAISRTKPPKSGTLTEFPQPESAVAVEEAPPETDIAPEAAPEVEKPADPPKRGRGAPKKTDPPFETNFFQRVAAVPLAEWGTRVYLYLYQIEPVCDLKQSGGKAYLMRYQEPVRDEHQIMLEQGSGKYRLVLALNKISPANSNELARYEFEIYNPKYPPRIPKAVWVNDPRNRRWEALLPKEEPPVPVTAASTIVDAMKMVSDIRRDVRDEMAPEPADAQSPSEMVQTFKAMKDILAPATATTAAKDPIELATALAQTMMQMKADNPVIDLYRDELKALREEMKEERAARATDSAAPAEKPKTLMEQLTDFKALKDLFTNNNGSEAVRVGRTTALDVTRDIATKFFESDLASGVGQWLGSLAQRNVSNPAPNNMNGTPPVQVQQAAPDQFQAFIRDVLNPSLLRHYLQEFSGADFAGWLYDGYPDRLIQLQSFTHPMMPGLKGAPAIIQAYKRTDSMWPALSSRGEQAFADFVHQFCEWKPEAAVDAEVIEAQPEDESKEKPERI